MKHRFWVTILAGIIALGIAIPAFSMGGVRSDHSTSALVFKEYVTGSGAAIHFGVDDDGLDVKFFGATSGAYALWDESEDKMIFEGADLYLNDNDKLYFGDAGAEGELYSDGSGIIFKGQIQTVSCKFGTVAASTDDERPVFVAPFDCELVNAYLVNASAIATSDTACTTLQLTDKSSAGASTNSIASVTNAGTSGTTFAAFDAVSMGTLSATYASVDALDTVTLKKTDSGGTGCATDELIVVITYKRR